MTHAFDWITGCPSRRLPAFGRHVVSTPQPRHLHAAKSAQAAKAGRRMPFYGGEIAHAAAAHAKANDGSIPVDDFAAYRPEGVEPIGMDFANHTMHEIPPNGQAAAY